MCRRCCDRCDIAGDRVGDHDDGAIWAVGLSGSLQINGARSATRTPRAVASRTAVAQVVACHCRERDQRCCRC